MENYSVEAILTAVDTNFTATIKNAQEIVTSLTETINQTTFSISEMTGSIGVFNLLGQSAALVKESLEGMIACFSEFSQSATIFQELGTNILEMGNTIQTLTNGITLLPALLNTASESVNQLVLAFQAMNQASVSVTVLSNTMLTFQIICSTVIQSIDQYTNSLSATATMITAWNELQLLMGVMLDQLAEKFTATFTIIQGGLSQVLQSGIAIINLFIGKITEFTMSLVLMNTTFTTIVSGMGNNLKTVSNAMTPIQTMMKGITDFLGKITNLIKGFTDLGKAIEALFTFIGVAEPVVLLVTVIVALVAAVIYLWNTNEGFRDAIITAWTTIINFLQPAITAISDFIQQIFGNLLAWWQENQQTILSVIQTVWTIISTVIQTILSNVLAIVSGIFNQIKNVINLVMGVIKGIITTVLSLISGDWSGVLAGIQMIIGAFGTYITSTFDNFMSTAKEIVSNIIDGIKAVFESIKDIDLLKTGKAIMDGFLDGLKSAWEAVKKFVGGIGKWIKDHKGPIRYDAKLLIPAGQSIMSSLNDGLINGFKDVEKTITEMTDTIQDNLAVMSSIEFGSNLESLDSKMSTQVEHKFAQENNNKPAVFNIQLGNQQFKAFVHDISDVMGGEMAINMQF